MIRVTIVITDPENPAFVKADQFEVSSREFALLIRDGVELLDGVERVDLYDLEENCEL